jgi:uncharacterized SAM-binding protein YcdF (DUF218 family)
MKKPAQVACAVIGTLTIAYYTALQLADRGSIADPGRLIGFSLVWALFGLAAWAIAFRGDQIAQALKRIFFRTKARSIATVTAASLFLAVSSTFLALILIPFHTAAPKTDRSKAARPEYLIVLGGGIRRDGTVSTILKSRLDRAAAANRENPGMILVVTGGKSRQNPWPEADAMARYLEQKEAIPEAAIIREPTARDTIQNFSRSLALIRANAAARDPARNLEADPPRVAVLTSGFHLNRALFLARRTGITPVDGIRAPCPPLQAPNACLREVGAYWKLGIRLIVQTLLGR